MSKKTIILLITVSALLVGFFNWQINSTKAPTNMYNDLQISLSFGEEKEFPGLPGTKIGFMEVKEDKRCPQDVDCEQAGWATVIVNIISDKGQQLKELYIRGGDPDFYWNAEPSDGTLGSGNVFEIENYQVHLAALNPYPLFGKQIKPEEYEAVFMAEKK